MSQLDYATAHSDSDLHLDDEYAYRFRPSAWMFTWLWWNVVLLVLVTLTIVALSVSDGTLKSPNLSDVALATVLQTAPLAIAISLLLAHQKVDLSFPMQIMAATYLFQWLARVLDFSDPAHLAGEVLIVVVAGALVGLVHWCLCTLLGAPSALVTILSSGVLVLAATALVGRDRWAPSPIKNPAFYDLVKLLLRWGPGVLALGSASVVTVWLVVRRTLPAVDRQVRREVVAELIGFVLLGVVCALSAASSSLDPAPSRSTAIGGIGNATLLAAVLASVVIGGTIFGGKLPNPLGALLGSILTGASVPLVLKYVAPGIDPYATMMTLGGAAVGAACVILAYAGRLRSLLAALGSPSARARPISFVAMCGAGVAMVLLVFCAAMLPLAMVEPSSAPRVRVDPLIGPARLTLCLAGFGASATYLLLFAADMLMGWRSRARN